MFSTKNNLNFEPYFRELILPPIFFYIQGMTDAVVNQVIPGTPNKVQLEDSRGLLQSPYFTLYFNVNH